MLLAGQNVVVAGYGWCGRGVAMRARGMGAHVIVTEVDPVQGLEAVMDGFRVMPMAEAAPIGDVFVTVTGNKNVIDGATLREDEGRRDRVQLRPLQRRDRPRGAGRIASVAPPDARVRRGVHPARRPQIFVLGEGRLINLAAAEGHPASVMDMSFANQALALEYMVANHAKLEKKVYPVPEALDERSRR